MTVVAAVTIGLAACGDDPVGPDEQLAERVASALAAGAGDVVERLSELGVATDEASVADAAVRCPAVREPAPGDRATCTATVGGTEVDVDVELGAGDAVTVIGVEVGR
jgi:hypothetical protein